MSTPGRVCLKTGKHFHAARGEALAQQRSLSGRKDEDVEPYYCESCGGWHVGRQKKRAHRSKYGKQEVG